MGFGSPGHFTLIVLVSSFIAQGAFSAPLPVVQNFDAKITYMSDAAAGASVDTIYRIQVNAPTNGQSGEGLVRQKVGTGQPKDVFKGPIDLIVYSKEGTISSEIPLTLHRQLISQKILAVGSGNELIIFDGSDESGVRIPKPKGNLYDLTSFSANRILMLSGKSVRGQVTAQERAYLSRFAVIGYDSAGGEGLLLVDKSDGSVLPIFDDFHSHVVLDARDHSRLVVIRNLNRVAPGEGESGEYEVAKFISLKEKDLAPLKNARKGDLDFSFRLKKVREYLETHIIEQPEAVRLATNLEASIIANSGVTTRIENAMLIGLPGTGKDTTVEAFLIAHHMAKYGATDPEKILSEHLFALPKLKNEGDIWAINGSATGYKGSGKLSPFIKFLVKHSAGRYEIVTVQDGNSTKQYVSENEAWEPGMVLPGYFEPTDAVVFGNELHDWKKEYINSFLKEPFEKRRFTIGDPGPGVATIKVPVIMFLASNNGIDLISSKDETGKRYGKPLTYEQQMARWTIASRDKARLKDAIKRSSPGNEAGGLSDEMVDRLPDARLLLLRPISPEGKRKIVNLSIEAENRSLRVEKPNGYPHFQLKTTKALEDFLVSYGADPEEGPRGAKGKINSLVQDVITNAILDGELQVKPGATLVLDVAKNKDNTYRLLVNGQPFFMKETEVERTKKPISDKELAEFGTLAARINKHVKGVEHIVDQFVDVARASANSGDKDAPANVYAFFGVSSTGKTELAQAINKELFKSSEPALVIDFSKIKTVDELKRALTGTQGKKSDFMASYDRANGKLLVVFDEFDKAPLEVQHECYDLLREKVISSFSDRVPREMKNVNIILTGNTGTDWYHDIPRDIPEEEQWAAARDINKKMTNDPGLIRAYLMKKYSEAFINRIGLDRFFWFPPHTHATIRDLIDLKFTKLLKDLNQESAERRTWHITFLSDADYKRTIEATETYGFHLWEQGASIDNFVNKNLGKAIESALLREKVPSGAKVAIVKSDDVVVHESFGEGHTKVNFNLVVEGRSKPIPLTLRGRGEPEHVRPNPLGVYLTSAHEVGHGLMSMATMGDKYQQLGLTVLPGVIEIREHMVRYLGLASSQKKEDYELTREFLIAKIAQKAGGEAAEMLFSKNHVKSAGSSNDMQGATLLAQDAIARYGFSDRWGRRTIQPDQSLTDFLASLSNEEKSMFQHEVEKVLQEGRALALKILKANFGLLVSLTNHLSVKGEFDYEEYGKVEKYVQAHLARPGTPQFEANIKKYDAMIAHETPPKQTRDPELFSFLHIPEKQVVVEEWRKRIIDADKANAKLEAAKTFGYSMVTTDLKPFGAFLRQSQLSYGVTSETRRAFVIQAKMEMRAPKMCVDLFKSAR